MVRDWWSIAVHSNAVHGEDDDTRLLRNHGDGQCENTAIKRWPSGLCEDIECLSDFPSELCSANRVSA